MWHLFLAYLKYLYRAKTKYRIHSPFVYTLITEAFERDVESTVIKKHYTFKKDLLKDEDFIDVEDYGAGSRVFTSNHRKVADIAKHAGISTKKTRLLQQLMHFLKPTKILEIGTSLGLGSAAMAIAAMEATITTIEGCPSTAGKAQQYFEKHKLNNIQVIHGLFEEKLPELCEHNKYDIIYFDGNHQKNATIDYFEKSLKSIHNDSLFIFDDIHWSKGMEEAWEFIKKHPKTKITIDLFDLGLVFFRKEQVEQDFIIRM